MLPKDLKYTLSHEWVKIKGRTAYIGLTEFALEGLGKVLNLELPNRDDELLVGVALGDVETVDALHEITSPVEGLVTEVNKAVFRNLDILSRDPYKRGWLIKVKLSTPLRIDSLLSAEEYLSRVQKKLKK
ncbi:MAG: glycine cleavage system protein H [Candidatus Brocadiales bacterium]